MKLYLETTVPSFLFADDAPERQEVTRQFFKWLAISPDKLYISELVLAELNRASPDVRNKLLEAVVRLPVENLSITDEAVDLAGRYVRDGVIPARYRAVLNNLDVVVTWNMKHLANVRRIEGINRTNLAMRLPLIRIHTPEEVIDL
jgi:predicted nucleic acid-binding protein